MVMSNPIPLSEKRTRRGKDILEVFAHYRGHHPGAHKNPISTSIEWRRIRDRLKEGSTVKELCLAIDGCHVHPWNCGENPSGTQYFALKLIMKDGSQVTRFIEAWRRRGEPVLSEKIRTGMRATASWVAAKRKGLDRETQ